MKEGEISQPTVSQETPQKTSQVTLRDFNGGKLRTGNPGNKGGGRTPEAFKDFLKRLRADPEFQDELEAAAKNSLTKGYGSALKVVTDYDDDKPAEKRQIVGPVEVHVKVVREGRRLTAG